MFIKTTDSRLVNLDAIATIYTDGFTVIAIARDLRGDGIHKPHTHIYTLGMYQSVIQAINALNDLEKSIAAQSPLHIMQDPDPEPEQ